MSLKFFKYFFVGIILGLTIIGIYIVYIKNDGSKISSAIESRETNISKEISIGIIDFDTINPILTKNLEIGQLTKLVYKPLIEISKDFKPEPTIAEQWSKIDELTYMIKLNNNIKWADGEKISFEDIEFTINTIKDADTIYKRNIQTIDRIEKINEDTFKIYLAESTDFFEYYLCFPIMQEKSFYSEIPIGNGDYTISKVDDKEIVIEGDKMKLTIKIYNTTTELYNNFSRGNIDLIITQNPNYEKYIGNIGFEENIIIGRDFYYISCENIDSEKVRTHICNNINKEKIVYELFNNKYILADFPLEYGSYLNKEKNIKNKSEIPIKKMKINLSTQSENKLIAEAIKNQLQEKGININVQNYTNPKADLILKKETMLITPDIKKYFNNKETIEKLNKIEKIDNMEILEQEYEKIINKYYEETPFISLFFNSYIILHSDKLKGDFSGNWYNMFYNIDSWYKVM